MSSNVCSRPKSVFFEKTNIDWSNFAENPIFWDKIGNTKI